MATRRGPGVLTTILMLIPMIAVPMMALFGVPHFMPVVASPTQPEYSEPFVGFRETRTGQSDTVLWPVSLRTQDAFGESVDLFQPYGGESTVSDTTSVRWSDPLKSTSRENPESLFADDPSTPKFDNIPNHEEPPAGLVSIFDSRPGGKDAQSDSLSSTHFEQTGEPTRKSASATSNRQSLSWSQASKILDDLGVQTYSLSPGLNPGEFRFVCLVSSTDNPRVSRRFESHSANPLIAVEQVIGQVTRWTRSSSR
jgi:hypothetical protein